VSLIQVERRVSCKSNVAQLWDLLADTERLNRAVGMDRITIKPLTNSSAARYTATTRLGGFSVEFEERPFEWVYPKFFRIFREMRGGPFLSVKTEFYFEPLAGGGTDVRACLTLEPRFSVLSAILRFKSQGALNGFEHEILKVDHAIQQNTVAQLHGKQAVVQRSALERAAGNLRQATSSAYREQLIQWVDKGSDLDLCRLRPYELAERWGASREETLNLFLHAVKAGLLDMNWDLVCPSCLTASSTIPSLNDLEEHGNCQLCDISFDITLDTALEATFRPQSAIRTIDVGPYCIGGPRRTPHVMAQTILPPHGQATLEAPAIPGSYQVFIRGGMNIPLRVTEDGPKEQSTFSKTHEQEIVIGLSGNLIVTNTFDDERHAKIELRATNDLAATARDLTALPTFRREFSSETLKPGISLQVSRVALLFSDLTDSTQLYSTVGDAAAFRLVQEHFDVVLAEIEKHHGALVKTIGDAVMASFNDDLEAVQAALSILNNFENFRKKHPNHELTHIKLGIYGGPCYVVTANNVLDYFGQTVNIAARLQGEAKSGQLITTAETAKQACEHHLMSSKLITEHYQAKLKGVDHLIDVARIQVTK
jgi:adenylate cyclase